MIALRGILPLLVVAACALAIACEDDREAIQRQNDSVLTPSSGGSGSKGDTNVFDLRTGDCVAEPSDDLEVDSVKVVDCEGPDAIAKVSLLFTVDKTSGAYPGEDYMDQQATARCPDPEGPAMWPTSQSWELGDRTVLCFDELE